MELSNIEDKDIQINRLILLGILLGIGLLVAIGVWWLA